MGYLDLTSEEITDGHIPRAIVVLAIPLVAQNMVHVAKQVIDLFWVGKLGDAPVAAIGLASPIYSLAISLSISGTFIAINILVSRRVGADDEPGAYRAAFTGTVAAAIIAVLTGIAFVLSADTLVSAITELRPGRTESLVRDLSVEYIQVLAGGLVFAGISDSIEANFLARGDSRATLYMNLTGVVVTLLLDPVLIFGVGPVPALGIAGAAAASVLGSVGSLVLGTTMAVRGRAGGIYSARYASIRLDDLRELFSVGYPRIGQGLASNFGSLAMVVIVFAVAGTAGLSSYTIVSRVIVLSMLFVGALRSAAQSIIGQNLGAGNPSRASQTTVVGAAIGVALLSVFSIVQWVYAVPIVKIFVPDIGDRALQLSVDFIRIFALANPFGAVISLVKSGFNGAKHTRTTMIVSLVQTWGLQIPMAVVAGLVLGYGAVGVFWARALSIIVAAAVFASYFLYKERNGLFARAVERPADAD